MHRYTLQPAAQQFACGPRSEVNEQLSKPGRTDYVLTTAIVEPWYSLSLSISELEKTEAFHIHVLCSHRQSDIQPELEDNQSHHRYEVG